MRDPRVEEILDLAARQIAESMNTIGEPCHFMVAIWTDANVYQASNIETVEDRKRALLSVLLTRPEVIGSVTLEEPS